MWDVPGWAIGVGIIILASSLGKALRPLLSAHADRISGRSSSESELTHFRAGLDDVQKGSVSSKNDSTLRNVCLPSNGTPSV